jgi:HTH-type transcriptional regulator / antitoxin HipB
VVDAFPLRIPDQLRQHLRALRQQRGLTQAQLGALVGVSQARIAEIEANPGLVNLEQVMTLLAVLEAGLSLRVETLVAEPGARYAATPSRPRVSKGKAAAGSTLAAKFARTSVTKKGSW